MYKAIKKCSKCSKDILYIHRASYHRAVKTNAKCRECRRAHNKTKEFADTVRKAANGKKWGGDPYPYWLAKHGKNWADKKQAEVNSKKGQSGSKNPMYGRPSPQGAGNGWKGWYKGRYFRSIREVCAQIEFENNGRLFVQAETMAFAIPYVDYAGMERTYFPDFLVDNKYLYEIKPKRLWNTPKCIAKKTAAELFCDKNGYVYIMHDPNIDFMNIEEKWKAGEIRWMGCYEQKFKDFVDAKYSTTNGG